MGWLMDGPLAAGSGRLTEDDVRGLLALERRRWWALSTEGGAARGFYGALLRQDAVMLLPGGLRLEGRDAILASLDPPPWDWSRVVGVRVVELGREAAVVMYRVVAARAAGDDAYEALVSTTYVRDDGWKLVVHQQTPS